MSANGHVLVVAGVDSSGGAGLCRDVATLTAHDVPACCAVTAVTAQSNAGLLDIQYMSPSMVTMQMRAAFTSHDIAAIKVGMLGNAAIVEAVQSCVRQYPHVPLVLDPVLRTSSGGVLLDEAGIDALRTLLLPLATVLTPNVEEAAVLLDQTPQHEEAKLIRQARQLFELGATTVLLKGGHAAGEIARDWLVAADYTLPLDAPRLAVRMRGTGCALSTGVAAHLARNHLLPLACREAKGNLWRHLRRQLRLGDQLGDQ